MSVYSALSDTSKKKFVVLIDPDKPTDEQVVEIVEKSKKVGVDFFFVGGHPLLVKNAPIPAIPERTSLIQSRVIRRGFETIRKGGLVMFAFWKKLWKEFVGILMILAWASFGNAVYDRGYNWFFIESSIFPFLSDEIMPLMVVLSVFGVCLVVYGIYFTVRHFVAKKQQDIVESPTIL